ncbi:hypothetical protein DPEC_G00188270 [Dallia pectoralis]|uniref:Uncharacterized protein n=1 Tax=Dallia pectoralis TaxID=75939 RepID=A0ACC2GC91_DALPE|nr:hypothetical protein DPEC_G00188270 [Dallia pectoralis]
MERGDPVGFMTGFFTEVLGTTLVPNPLNLDRAHRIGAPPTPDGVNTKPRVFIIRFHNFQDLTSSVAKKKALFLGIKRRLSEKKKFSLRFPARLFLEHAGERLTFDSHEDPALVRP